VVGQRVGLDPAGDRARALAADGGHARVVVVGRAIDPLGLEVDVAIPDLLDGQTPERLAVRSGEVDDVALADVEVRLERDRDRPDLVGLAGQAHVLADRPPVVRSHEALERRETAVGEQLEV
jgi:hypothetical protein